MPLTIPYAEPQLAPSNAIFQPNTALVTPTQNAAWKRGDILSLSTTGSITSVPGNGSGSLAGIAGPAVANITITNHAVSGAPAAAYWIIASYSGSSAESQGSQEILYNAPAGNVPAVNVSATGAPAAATGFNVYAGLLPGNEVQQVSGGTLGTASNLAYPLTNYQGANAIASNPSGNILGLAQSNSESTFGANPGGAFLSPRNAFGSTADFPPLAPTELSQLYVITLDTQPLEISLSQSYALEQSLIGTQVGLTVDSVSTWVYADPAASNKLGRIVGIQQTLPALIINNATATAGTALGPGPTGSFGDIGGRVIVQFTSGLIL